MTLRCDASVIASEELEIKVKSELGEPPCTDMAS